MFKKIKEKKGGTVIITILIVTVIITSVTLYCAKSLGNSISDGARDSKTIIDNLLE